MSSVEEVPFCQHNIRLWAILLSVSSAGVLAFAIWLGISKPRHGDTAPLRPTAGVVDPRAQLPAGGGVATPDSPAALPGEGAQYIAWQKDTPPAMQLQLSFNRAADVIRPCVVNINAVRPPVPQPALPDENPRFLNPFGGAPNKIIGGFGYESVGSGVIVDPTGYIVTNEHLIAGATSIMVSRFNQTAENLPARVVLSLPKHDLAVLKVEGAAPFPAATLGDSSQVEVGDWVLAVGNPFGLSHTVTAGIISGKRSSLMISGVQYLGMLQTDAPINKGSSGGPLVNLAGEVIGINTAIYAPTGVFNGTGFAIPSNRVARIVARALEGQPNLAAQTRPLAVSPEAALAPAPWLGLGVVDVGPALAAKLALARPGGVFVNSVAAGSPAAEAEITRGDVITQIAGRPIDSTAGLLATLSGLPFGQVVPVTVWRNGASKTLNARIVARQQARR